MLKPKVTLPSHRLCGLIYGAEMLGAQRQTLEEPPDRQWRQTHRIESSRSCRLGPMALRAEGLCKLGERADGPLLDLSQNIWPSRHVLLSGS